MIKKPIIIASMMLALAFACSPKNEKTTIIKAEGLKIENGSAYVTGAKNKVLDSVGFTNGKFQLSFINDIPQIVYVYILDSNKEMYSLVAGYLEQTNINLSDKNCTDDKRVASLSGSILNELNIKYRDFIRNNNNNIESNKISQQISKKFAEGDKNSVNELSMQRDSLQMLLIDDIFNYHILSEDNKLSELAQIHQVCLKANGLSLENKKRVLDKMPSDYNMSMELNALREDVAAESKLAIGSLAPEFKLYDLSGKEYSLKDFKGKYVYINFSASWCGWCKKELPYIRTAYESFKNNDIVFITINMDKQRNLWEHEVEKEKISWYCLSDLNGMESKLAKDYNIHGIPACFILDKDGKFLKKNIRTNEMIDFITALFNN